MKSINKYQLQQELKNELRTRKPEGDKFIISEDFITIEYQEHHAWIFVDWKGRQTEQSIKKGCEKLLETSEIFHCSKILSDNTHTSGVWTTASAWVGNNWFPRIKKSGVKFFAWVYSSEPINWLSELIQNKEVGEIVQTFEDLESARKMA